MTTAIVVPNTLPAVIIALSDEALAKSKELAFQASTIQVTADPASLEKANAIYREIDKHSKGIAAARLELTRPIDALKAEVIEAERQATVPMAAARESLGRRIAEAQEIARKAREEAQRKAREQAEAVARAERERLEAERALIIAKQEEERKRQAEEAALFGHTDPLPEQEPPPPAVVVVPVIEATVMPPELPKSAVRTSKRQRLVIDDVGAIPVSVGGVRVLVPDDKAIERLLKAGITVPGCRLESYEQIGSAGSRGQ